MAANLREGGICCEKWPAASTLYAGYNGSLPRRGDKVEVRNLFDDSSKVGTVIVVLHSTREYTVAFYEEDPKPVQLSLWPEEV